MKSNVEQFGSSTASGHYMTCLVGGQWYFCPAALDWLANNANNFSRPYQTQEAALLGAEDWEAQRTTMPERKRKKRPRHFEISPELDDQFRAFLAERGTTPTYELTEALRRHLAYPPPVPDPAPAPYVEPKRPRGRPRKEAGNGAAQ
jgi:hypothetical protein